MFKQNIEEIICEINGEYSDMLMDVKTIKIKAGESKEFLENEKEMAILLINGKGYISWENEDEIVSRSSLFDEEPTCLHVCNGIKVVVKSITDMEILIQGTYNDKNFESKLYTKENTKSDIFGEGVLQGTSRRIVRTIFDYNNAPYSNMVMGEVITYPGKWSSYTPHHHPQPEVYYYRFDRAQGFGVSVIGENAFIIKDKSASIIPGGLIHPQTSAPGYAMYYCWMIRHLDNNPWTDRIDDENHTSMLKEYAKIWEGK